MATQLPPGWKLSELRVDTDGEGWDEGVAEGSDDCGSATVVVSSHAFDAVVDPAVGALVWQAACSVEGDLGYQAPVVEVVDDGVAAARLFVKDDTLAVRLTRGDQREVISSNPGDGAITAPIALLVDQGTAGPAEVFAAALAENDRADLVGINTLGRAARQRPVKLPDQRGLWLTYMRYLTPDSDPIHETGLEPDVDVEFVEIEFGSEPPSTDEALQKAIEHLAK